MIPKGTERKRCKRCCKIVLVPRVTPCENRFFLNGIWLFSMDEAQREHTVGVLCFECGFEIEMGKVILEGCSISLGFCGGMIQDLDNWDAMIVPKREI